MLVKIIYGNFSGNLEGMSDWMLFIKLALEEAGYGIEFEKKVTPNHINVIFDGFDEKFAETITSQNTQTTPIVIISTEYITGKTFNTFFTPPLLYRLSGLTFGRELSKHAKTYQKRYDLFLAASQKARGLWTLAPDQVALYQQVAQTNKVFHLPFAYLEKFSNLSRNTDSVQKNIDFLFSGTNTPYRRQILCQIQQRGYNVACTLPNTPQVIRNSMIARSRVALNIRQNDKWRYASTMRMFYHIMNHSLLISESCLAPSELDNYVIRFPPSTFVDQCCSLIEEGDLARKEQALFERFRIETSMKNNIELLMNSTF